MELVDQGHRFVSPHHQKKNYLHFPNSLWNFQITKKLDVVEMNSVSWQVVKVEVEIEHAGP